MHIRSPHTVCKDRDSLNISLEKPEQVQRQIEKHPQKFQNNKKTPGAKPKKKQLLLIAERWTKLSQKPQTASEEPNIYRTRKETIRNVWNKSGTSQDKYARGSDNARKTLLTSRTSLGNFQTKSEQSPEKSG